VLVTWTVRADAGASAVVSVHHERAGRVSLDFTLTT
jgi:hypothetical protein